MENSFDIALIKNKNINGEDYGPGGLSGSFNRSTSRNYDVS